MNAMIYAAGLAAVLTAGVIHTVIATRELLGCGKELSAWKALKIAFRLLPALIAVAVNGSGYASFVIPAEICAGTMVTESDFKYPGTDPRGICRTNFSVF